MFEPGHLHRKSLPGMPGPEFDVDVHYEVRHDPSEGKLMHFKMSGHIGGQAFVEEFDMHSDTAFNFASLLAKVAVTAVLMVLAWRNRSSWVPSARGHRVSAEVSGRRSGLELTLMAVALTLAAALAVTG